MSVAGVTPQHPGAARGSLEWDAPLYLFVLTLRFNARPVPSARMSSFRMVAGDDAPAGREAPGIRGQRHGIQVGPARAISINSLNVDRRTGR
jgi:hypothetical protein